MHDLHTQAHWVKAGGAGLPDTPDTPRSTEMDTPGLTAFGTGMGWIIGRTKAHRQEFHALSMY